MADDTRRKLAGLALLLFLFLAVYALVPRVSSHSEDRSGSLLLVDAPRTGNRVVGVDVYHESPDELVLDVEYVYTGDQGRDSFIGAITTLEGASTGHWSYVPAQVLPGRHTARLNLRINDDAPETYRSDAIVFEFYLPGRSPFFKQEVAFTKRWHKDG